MFSDLVATINKSFAIKHSQSNPPSAARYMYICTYMHIYHMYLCKYYVCNHSQSHTPSAARYIYMYMYMHIHAYISYVSM